MLQLDSAAARRAAAATASWAAGRRAGAPAATQWSDGGAGAAGAATAGRSRVNTKPQMMASSEG
eukprot:745939-Hanusia_phi.AAC.1